MNAVSLFLSGAVTAQCLVISLFFRRYARKTADQFFLYFSVLFLLLAIERILLLFLGEANEFRPLVYLIRLAAFSMIIVAILFKNNQSRLRV